MMAAEKVSDIPFTTVSGSARLVTWRQNDGMFAHALVYGQVDNKNNVLTRIHSACITSEVFGANNCDCHEQLQKFISEASNKGGILIYLPQEGRGNGIEAKLKQMELEEAEPEHDTISAFKKLGYPADARKYELAAKMLNDLGVKSVELYSLNIEKIQAVKNSGIKVSKNVDYPIANLSKTARKNLRAKRKNFRYTNS